MKVKSSIVTMRSIKPAVFFILQILTGTNLYCQVQENMIDFLTSKFEDYIEAVPWEEMYLHTDREEYIAGEYIWTSIYLIERQSLKPTERSKIAYIELLNSENRPVVQKRFLLINGTGPGQLQLPDTLSTGSYTLRAYTNWMKNFLPYNCFTKDIMVYNALRSNKYIHKTTSVLSGSKEIKMTEKNSDSGLSMIISSTDNKLGALEIVINADNNYTLRNGNQFYLFIQTHGRIDRVSSEKLTGNNARIIVPKNTLSPGINQITVFNSRGQPACENYNYTPLGESKAVSLSLDESYRIREKIILDLNIEKGVSETHNSANLSVSVIPSINTMPVIGLNDYLLFGTEFGFDKPVTSRITDLSPEQIDSILQNIRSNWINWEEVLSGHLPHFKYLAEKEEHFLSGKLSNDGQTINPKSETVLLFMPGRDPEFQFAKTDKSGDFIFRINIDEDVKDLVIMPDDVSKKKKIILESSFSDKNIKTGIPVNSDRKSFPDFIEEWSVNYQVRKIYGIEEAGNPLQSKVSPFRPVSFYGKPDIELILADYVSLPKMEEIFYELLPNVSMKKRNSGYKIIITNRINDNRYELSPDLFLDGVIIKDASIIAELDPLIVERIDVVKEKYFVGSYSFPGIVNIMTRSADFSCVPLPGYMVRFPYRVLDPLKSFFSPDYSSLDLKNSTIPDLRNTLYWNPSVKTDIEGKIMIEFWTSDFVSEYEINVQGITSEGEVISTRKRFRIE